MRKVSKGSLLAAAAMCLLMTGCSKDAGEDKTESTVDTSKIESEVGGLIAEEAEEEIAAEADTATVQDAEPEKKVSNNIVKLQELIEEIGVARTGTFDGKAIKAEEGDFWKEVDFGYSGTGILSAEFFGQNDEYMLVYYVGKDSKVKASLYKDNGKESEFVAKTPLSYVDAYERNEDYLLSNAIVSNFGTEGFISATTLKKGDDTYIVTENNHWHTYDMDKQYFSDRERGYTADATYSGDMVIYKLTDKGLEGQYMIKTYCYGMDGGGAIYLNEFQGKELESHRFGDLGDDPHTIEEYFMDEYNAMMAGIGFPELTNTDEKKLIMEGVAESAGTTPTWKAYWDCNTELKKGDDAVRLEVNDTSIEQNPELAFMADAREKAAAAEPASEEVKEEVTEAKAPSGNDDERFAGFFSDVYPEVDDGLYLSANKIAVKYAYSDLDGDGINELLIGDSEGVYTVITENDGEYFRSDVCGWMRQYGAVPTQYLGNGCFATSVYNGNNYGGPFREDELVKYSSSLNGFGVIMRLTSSWDPSSVEENYNCWDLYTANDENNIVSNVSDDESLYTHDYIDYGKNYTFDADGNVEDNELSLKFKEAVKTHTTDGALGTLDWKDLK